MKIEAVIIIMIVAGIIILTFYVIGLYNKLIDTRNKVNDKFKSIEEEFNKIINKLDDLVEVISNHTKHEHKILSSITNVKNDMITSKTINEKISAYNKVCKVFEDLDKLEKTYPKLEVNKKFISLKKDLDEIDNKIIYSSSFYNDVVFEYNKLINVFPSNVVAYIFKFKKIVYINKENK